MENVTYYIALLVLIIIGFLVVKRVANCLIKSVITLLLLGLMAAVWYFYLR